MLSLVPRVCLSDVICTNKRRRRINATDPVYRTEVRRSPTQCVTNDWNRWRHIVGQFRWPFERSFGAVLPCDPRYSLVVRRDNYTVNDSRVTGCLYRIGDYGLTAKGFYVFSRDSLAAHPLAGITAIFIQTPARWLRRQFPER